MSTRDRHVGFYNQQHQKKSNTAVTDGRANTKQLLSVNRFYCLLNSFRWRSKSADPRTKERPRFGEHDPPKSLFPQPNLIASATQELKVHPVNITGAVYEKYKRARDRSRGCHASLDTEASFSESVGCGTLADAYAFCQSSSSSSRPRALSHIRPSSFHPTSTNDTYYDQYLNSACHTALRNNVRFSGSRADRRSSLMYSSLYDYPPSIASYPCPTFTRACAAESTRKSMTLKPPSTRPTPIDPSLFARRKKPPKSSAVQRRPTSDVLDMIVSCDDASLLTFGRCHVTGSKKRMSHHANHLFPVSLQNFIGDTLVHHSTDSPLTNSINSSNTVEANVFEAGVSRFQSMEKTNSVCQVTTCHPTPKPFPPRTQYAVGEMPRRSTRLASQRPFYTPRVVEPMGHPVIHSVSDCVPKSVSPVTACNPCTDLFDVPGGVVLCKRWSAAATTSTTTSTCNSALLRTASEQAPISRPAAGTNLFFHSALRHGDTSDSGVTDSTITINDSDCSSADFHVSSAFGTNTCDNNPSKNPLLPTPIHSSAGPVNTVSASESLESNLSTWTRDALWPLSSADHPVAIPVNSDTTNKRTTPRSVDRTYQNSTISHLSTGIPSACGFCPSGKRNPTRSTLTIPPPSQLIESGDKSLWSSDYCMPTACTHCAASTPHPRERSRLLCPTVLRPPRPPIRTTSLVRDSGDVESRGAFASSVSGCTNYPPTVEQHSDAPSTTESESAVNGEVNDKLADNEVEQTVSQLGLMWWLRLLPYKPSNLPSNLAYRLRQRNSLMLSRSSPNARLSNGSLPAGLSHAFIPSNDYTNLPQHLMTQSLYEQRNVPADNTSTDLLSKSHETDSVLQQSARALSATARPSSMYTEKTDGNSLLLPSLNHLVSSFTNDQLVDGHRRVASRPSDLPISSKLSQVERPSSSLPHTQSSDVNGSTLTPCNVIANGHLPDCLSKLTENMADSPLLGQYCRLLILRTSSTNTPMTPCELRTPSSDTPLTPV